MAGTTSQQPNLPAYSAHAETDARHDAVATIAATAGDKAASLLLEALDDPVDAIRDMAAEAVLARLLTTGGAGLAGLDDAVVAGARAGKPSAAMLMLLGYTSAGDDILASAFKQERLVKRPPGGPVVAAAVPASLALSRRGDRAGRARLAEIINGGDKNTIVFLLDGVGMIDAPEVLHQLAAVALGDARGWQGTIPSGSDSLQYRVMDKAVVAFVSRLKLKPGFDVGGDRRYSDEQIAIVKKLIDEQMPQ